MKLSAYAKKMGISYTTAFRYWKKGILNAKQLPTGTIIVFDTGIVNPISNKAVLYARVSSSKNKDSLESQLDRLRSFATVKGYSIAYEVKEIGSGLNDKRQKLEEILNKDDWSIIIIEHKDRLARFGVNFLQILLSKLNKKIEVINEVSEDLENNKE